MVTIDKLNQDKVEFLRGLEVEDLKAYIDNLIKNYYENYINNDSKGLKDSIEEITLFVDDFKDIYPNIDNYINHRLVYMSNKCLNQLFNRNLELFCPDEVDIKEDRFNYRELFDYELMDKIIAEEKEYEDRKHNCLNCQCPYYN